MTLPQFPSQDLAKLVLGYLAEEQLMTAYDEFLQASPYLDALRNEYDRIFMTSLRNILAEYRAVKIFVETCKPLVLRKKLVQCTNLLDVVKFLANNADINKIQMQDTSIENISLVKQNTSQTPKQNVCELCSSSSLSGCSCKSKQKSNVSPSYVETSSLEASVETTPLEDLPGSHVTRKKHVRVLEKETISESNIGLSESTKQSSSTSTNELNTLHSNTHCSQIQSSGNSSLPLSSITKPADTPECREKIEEFNTILKNVCKNKSQAENQNKSIPNASSFQEFASGVGGHENRNVPVPDSSTSENSIALASVSNNTNTEIFSNNLNEVAKSTELEFQQYNNYPYPRVKPKCKDKKIKILSDIKVDKPFPSMSNTKATTSTPLMQHIVINGTPAYKQNLPIINSNYTKDEIMAMPTIIVVPASGPLPNKSQSKPILAHKLQKAKTKSNSDPPPKLLGPLVIDISSSGAAETNKPEAEKPKIDQQECGQESGLVKTVDGIKNASVPKDNIMACSLQTNTPQVLPPVRKSSSTPRRNSHIRVLDFTTPRRILHETINEIGPNETDDKPVDIVVARSPNLIFSETKNGENNIVDMTNVKVHKIESCHYNNVTVDNANKQQVINKKINWDADLRTLATAGGFAIQPTTKPKSRPRKPKKKKAADTQSEQEKSSVKSDNTTENADKTTENADKITEHADKITGKIDITTEKTDKADKTTEKIDKNNDKANNAEKKPRSKRKLSPKPKKSKKRQKLEEEEAQYAHSELQTESKATVKPTFNIVAATNYIEPQDAKVVEINENKSNNEDINETPEAERLSLHNEIGARLNISEFLETPYKQVLYDIQMETPKFLNSVLPDEPISDIKIMSIPTPRFFDTPKPLATPSSYSSRPTDYSSGGSYYKPDDQDYLRIADLECPVTSSKELEVVKHVDVPIETACVTKRSSRPVRKCTKNVSYVNSCNVGNKTKDKVIDDRTEIASSSSDTTIGANNSFETNKEVTVKTPKNNRLKSTSKSESTKRKLESIKKRKSPMKKDKSNSFMKIKPRRPTPTKENTNKRTRWKKDIFSPNKLSKPQTNKKINVKEKNIHITPVVTPAPTKSRRKSSTPRKLHCTKTFNSESSGHESPDINASVKHNVTRDQNTASAVSSHDSDTEQIALRWSDDGSQDAKPKESESDDILKIQEYIETTAPNRLNENTGSLHGDLIKRGFDAETAKIIERDLLDSPSVETARPTHAEVTESKKGESLLDKSVETNTSVSSELQIVQDAESDDEFELSVYECNEDSHNYIKCNSDAKDKWKQEPTKLKDKFSMEVCIDDGVAIRLRATNFNMLFNNDPGNEGELGYSFRETEVAVSSISNIEKLYTPMKDHKSQCFEIFDSTLTSLDTPLKLHSPSNKEQKITEIEIVLEEEQVEYKEKTDVKKRKRLQGSNSSEEGLNESRKTKPEAQYLFNSTNIQDIDIESVLKKLHGP